MTALTPREKEVLAAALDVGSDYQAIADKLGIRHNTVNNHCRNIRRKLGTPTLAGAIGRALRDQEIRLEEETPS